MRKNYAGLAVWLLLPCATLAQPGQKIIDSQLERATVFLKGAQVQRTAKATVPLGRTELVFKGIAPGLDASSLQLKAEGKFTVLSVQHQMNYLQPQLAREETARLEARRSPLLERRELLASEQEMYQYEQAMLDKNQEVKGDANHLKALDLKEMMDFHRARWLEAKTKQLELARRIKQIDSTLQKIDAQLKALNAPQDASTSEVVVTVLAKEATQGSFILNYFVEEAGWFPTYDLRVENTTKPIELAYKANVRQNSGENWKDVRLTLSNGDPNQGGVRPQLQPWYLGYNRRSGQGGTVSYAGYSANPTLVTGRVIEKGTGEPLPGVNIMVEGTSVGTVTDVNGRYSLSLPAGAKNLTISYVGYASQTVAIQASQINIGLQVDTQALSEVVVAGLQGRAAGVKIEGYKKEKQTIPIDVTEVDGQTSISFDIATPYTIPTDGKSYAVEIKELELPATYQHTCVPKLDLGVFLTAQVTGWEQYRLMEGEANLFFEGTYLGKTVLDTRNLNDTLHISLGRDKGIVASRTKLKNFGKQQSLGTSRREERGWEISMRNLKRQAVDLVLLDQVPLSTNKEITVEMLDNDQAEVEPETGQLTWKLRLEPAREKTVKFRYEVKYPKSGMMQIE
jgi:Domain of unknown function (DUF4139)/N-terminal domain of unknown function (DUF4140)